MAVFIIAEAGVNHGGSAVAALALIDAAARAGADAVKFQTFRADALVSPGAGKVGYQFERTGPGDQLSMLRALELSSADHEAIARRCIERAIEFMSTPFDVESADMLMALGMRRIKIPSGEITNLPFVEALARTGLPLIVSTGMASMDEVEGAVNAIARSRKEAGIAGALKGALTLLQCTTAYPARVEDANLLAMRAMAERFAVPVGLSDHTEGILLAPVAAGMGAEVIEKHLTLDKSLEGPDHAASLSPSEFAEMVRNIRLVERALGTGEKLAASSEFEARSLVRRSITTKTAIPKGTPVTGDMLAAMRPGGGMAPSESVSVIGRRAARDLPKGHTLKKEDVE